VICIPFSSSLVSCISSSGDKRRLYSLQLSQRPYPSPANRKVSYPDLCCRDSALFWHPPAAPCSHDLFPRARSPDCLKASSSRGQSHRCLLNIPPQLIDDYLHSFRSDQHASTKAPSRHISDAAAPVLPSVCATERITLRLYCNPS